MRIITVEPILSDEETAALAGHLLDETHVRTLVSGEAVTVLKPDGSVLVKYLPNALPLDVCARAFGSLRDAATPSANRGMAAGQLDDIGAVPSDGSKVEGRTRYRALKKDGTISNTVVAAPVLSGIVGYFDRSARYPYCRTTAFSLDHPERFASALPFMRAIDRLFEAHMPDRYAAQRAVVEQTHPEWVIHGTVFTTVTVNRNFRTAVHQDAGDLKTGFGVMSVLEAGTYAGGFLCFPKYGVAVDMRTAGVCFADVHEWHGNTPITGPRLGFERVSTVLYYRERMRDCLSANEELLRVKNRRTGDKIV